MATPGERNGTDSFGAQMYQQAPRICLKHAPSKGETAYVSMSLPPPFGKKNHCPLYHCPLSTNQRHVHAPLAWSDDTYMHSP